MSLLRRLQDSACRHAGWLLFSLFMLGLALRLASIAPYPPNVGYWSAIYFDEWDYDSLARNLLQQGSYHCCTEGFISNATRPPGYPFSLAVLYSLLWRDIWVVRFAQALLDCINILLVYLIVRSVRFGPLVGLAAAALMAFYGPLIAMVPYVHDIVLSVTLFNVFFLVLVTGRNGTPKAAASGLVGGLCALVRPSFIAAAAGTAITLYGGEGTRRARLARVAVFAGVFAAVTLPWALRSSIVLRTPVVLTTAPGWHLWAFGLAQSELPAQEPREVFFGRDVPDEGAFYRQAVQLAAKSFAAHPLRCAGAGLARFARWAGGAIRPTRIYKPQAYGALVGYPPRRFPALDGEGLVYLTLIVTVAVLILKRRLPAEARPWAAAWWPLVPPVALYVLPHVIVVPMTQHHLMIEPVAAAAALSWIAVLVLGKSALAEPLAMPSSKTLVRVTLVAGAAVAVLLAVAMLRSARFRARPPAPPSTQGTMTYAEVRRAQRQHQGSLGPLDGRMVVWTGRLEYPARGWRFVPGNTLSSLPCVPDEHTCVARLAMWGSPENAFGEGNARLNIPAGLAGQLREGDNVAVGGRLAGTSCFGGIILEVEDIAFTGR